jgi:hypothetical protein
MKRKLWAKSEPGPDLQDITALVTAFEAINRVKLEIRMGRSESSRVPDLAVTMVAVEWLPDGGEARSLVSVSLNCLSTNLTSLAAVVTHGLYLLDGKLAAFELSGEAPK